MGKTFEQIKSSLLSWLSIDQESSEERLSDAVAGDIVNIVMREYLRRRESHLGERSTSIAATSLIPNYDYPADFSKPRKLWYVSSGNIVICQKINKDQFDNDFTYSAELAAGGPATATQNVGLPTHYTIWQGQLVVGPCPNANMTLRFDYWGLLGDLANGSPNNENRFTKECWEYLLFASLVKATEYGIEDERVGLWEAERQRFESAIDIEDAQRASTGQRSFSTEPG